MRPSAPSRVLVLGLRNPGPDYVGTRHNVGEEVVGLLARDHGLSFGRAPARIRAEVAEGRIGSVKVVLALPTTFMNRSGTAAGPLVRYFDVPPEGLVVVHDDIDLPFGRLRFHRGRGTGGHRGVESVAEAVGSLDFLRLRVGVGRPPGETDPAVYVLRPFRKTEREEADFLVIDAVEVLEAFLGEGPEAAVQAAGRRRTPDE